VESGGALFETYLNLMCSPKSSALWCAHLRSRQGLADAAPSPEVWQAIVNKECGRFAGFVLFATSSVAPKARTQSFLLTFAARFNGISRKGISYLAHHGYLMKLTQFDSHEKKAVARSKTDTR